MRRVALLEVRSGDRYRTHRAGGFPYLLGLVRAGGGEAVWWTIRLPAGALHAGGRFRFELDDGLRGRLGDALAAFRPEALVLNHRPSVRLQRWLRRALPGLRLADLSARPEFDDSLLTGLTVESAVEMLGGRPVPGSGWLLDEAGPCYDSLPLDGGGTDGSPEPLPLLHDERCPYAAPIATNRYFDGLDLPSVASHRGCSFCRGGPPAGSRLRTPMVDLLLRQIEAHQASAGPEARFEYLIRWGKASPRLDALLDRALARGIRPSVFTAMLRADTVLALGGRLQDLLPRLESAGHRLQLVSVGAENFSPTENARLNKGLTPEQLWACHDLLDRLRHSHPKALGIETDLFAGILFTPWTTPDDLDANLAAARRLGPGWLRRMIGSRLILWQQTPLLALARRDGLLAERFAGPGELSAVCANGPDQTESPWRFADWRTDRLLRLLVRLEPPPHAALIPPGDRLLAEIAAARALLPLGLAADYVGLAEGIVEAVAALGPEAGVGELFERLRRRPAGPCPETTGGEGWLAVGLTAPDTGGRLEFRVGRACPADHVRLPQAGGAWLWVAEDRLGGGAAGRAAPVVLAAMRLLTGDRLRPDEVPRWRQVVVRLASRAGFEEGRRWQVVWQPGRVQPAGSG